MAFIITLLIALSLTILELSFMPYFSIFSVGPFLVLPFLIDLSLKSRSNFLPIIAFLSGIFFDFSTDSRYPFYTILFLLIILINRIVFYRKSGYSNKITYIGILTVAVTAVYLSKLNLLYGDNFVYWQNYLFSYITCLILTILYGILMDRALEKYYLWLEEKTEK
ncbi:MAG: hypothetical protein WCI63_02335 [bacterium]